MPASHALSFSLTNGLYLNVQKFLLLKKISFVLCVVWSLITEYSHETACLGLEMKMLQEDGLITLRCQLASSVELLQLQSVDFREQKKTIDRSQASSYYYKVHFSALVFLNTENKKTLWWVGTIASGLKAAVSCFFNTSYCVNNFDSGH